jgi:ribonuclease E
MPNSNRGGGVSRKINNPADRKRLKSVVSELDIADRMAVIVRTAGSKRTKTEIKRDYSYLTKLWNDIRSNTMKSEAPSLIHEEGSLVKRAIRDIYTNDIEEVYVEGAESYKIAKTHMKMLIPSHAKRVVEFKGDRRLFQHHQVEAQLDQIHHNEVTLKSGGYLVLNQTEALVAIDVNSGKATRERNIEETAVKTNLEAAEEIGRQLKLRDLSGLVVIDFIDMEENRNQHLVERRLKEALRNDRARIQVGGISHFGLLEMSRQRLRPSLVESISQTCPHCEGTGRVRSVNSSALHILRVLEEEITGISAQELSIVVHTDVALYILNEKRVTLSELEKKANCKISIQADASLLENDYRLLKDNILLETKETPISKSKPETAKAPHHPPRPLSEEDTEDGDQPKRKRRGRRGGKRRRRRDGDEAIIAQASQTETETQAVPNAEAETEQKSEHPATSDAQSDKTQARPKLRRRRGNKPKQNQQPLNEADDTAAISTSSENSSEPQTSDEVPKAKKARKKTARNAVADTTAYDSETNKTSRPKSPKVQTKKAGAKKPPKKAVKKKQNSAGNQIGENSTDSVQQSTGREPIASVELGVTDVGNNAPAAKKSGWWSKS